MIDFLQWDNKITLGNVLAALPYFYAVLKYGKGLVKRIERLGILEDDVAEIKKSLEGLNVIIKALKLRQQALLKLEEKHGHGSI